MMKKGSNKEKCVIRNSILFTLLFAVLITVKPPEVKTANPEWMYYPLDAVVRNFVDDSEYMWIGTNDKGILKFHKESLTVVDNFKNGGDFLDLDNEGNLWFPAYHATYGGLFKYDGSVFTDYFYKDYGLTGYYEYSCIKIDNNGLIWIGTNKKGIISFDGKKYKLYNSENSGLPYLKNDGTTIMSIDTDAENNIWVAILGLGIAKFDGTEWRVMNDTNSGLPSNNINVLKCDKTGNLWVGTYNYGLCKYDGTNWTVFDTSNSGLMHNSVYSLAVDSSNIIWLSGGGYGLIKFDGANWTYYNTNNSQIKWNYIDAIGIDNKSNKWIFVGDGIKELGVNIFNEDGVILSIDENKQFSMDDLIITPNPVNENLYLNNKDYIGYKFQLFDSKGQGIMNGILTENLIDVSSLPIGIYFIRVSNGKIFRYSRFIKN